MNESKHLLLHAGAKEWMVICLQQSTDGRDLVSSPFYRARIQVRLGKVTGDASPWTPFSRGLPLWPEAEHPPECPWLAGTLLFASGHPPDPAWTNLLPRSKQPRSTKCHFSPLDYLWTCYSLRHFTSQVMKQKLDWTSSLKYEKNTQRLQFDFQIKHMPRSVPFWFSFMEQ